MNRRELFVDTLIALALTGYAQLEIWYPRAAIGVGDVTGSKPILTLTALAMTLPVASRRRFPLSAAVIVMLATAVQSVLTTPTQGLAGIVAAFLVLYTAGARCEATRAAVAGGAAFSAVAAGAKGAGDLAFGTLIFGGALLFGVAMRRRHLHTETLTRERDEAVATERRRLARELHDIVAHGVSTMVVQAQAGAEVLDSRPEEAHEALQTIEATGRQALVELRHLLGLLRPLEEAAGVSPQPRLGELDVLVDGVRRAGLPVELRIEGRATELPAGLDLTVYRIVQEALTNSLKHAGATRAKVLVRYLGDVVELEVTDDGTAAAATNGVGHGLIGMHERVALYGGELLARPRANGGFAVMARLPVELGES
jgi:signal transduction histidine kinase